MELGALDQAISCNVLLISKICTPSNHKYKSLLTNSNVPRKVVKGLKLS